MWLGLGLWLGTIALQSLLLAHLLRLRLAARFPCFFAYLTVSWASSCLAWIAYHSWPPYYSWVYWAGEVLTVLAGFALVWEVFRVTFHPFPATRDAAGAFLLVLASLVLIANVLLQVMGALPHGWYELFSQLPRWLRLLQASLLAAVLLAARHYGLALGRNVLGLALGFGFYASLSVVSIASHALGSIDLAQYGHLYAIAYLATLGIWTYAFRHYAPNRLPAGIGHLEQDFARLNAAIGVALSQVRVGLRRTLGG